MLDKSIDGALLALRKQTIRGGGVGLEHVEALLALRGVPMPQVRAPRRPDVARCRLMRLLVLAALRDGPKRVREIAATVAVRRPELPAQAAYTRTGQALARLKRAGLVTREGRLWGLSDAARGRRPHRSGAFGPVRIPGPAQPRSPSQG